MNTQHTSLVMTALKRSHEVTTHLESGLLKTAISIPFSSGIGDVGGTLKGESMVTGRASAQERGGVSGDEEGRMLAPLLS